MITLLNRRRVLVDKGLPYDAEIEYLENRNTDINTAPYIKTDYLANTNTVVQLKVYIPSEYQNNVGNRRRFIFGGRQSWSHSNCFAFNYKGSSPSYFGYNIGLKTNDNVCSAVYDTMYDIEVSSSNINVNGTDYAIDSSNVSNNTYTQDIFGLNHVNNHNSEYKMVGRIYFIKFLELGEVKLDLIPVRKGTTGYMYDKISGQLLDNAGTEDFVLGPDKILPSGYTQLDELSVTTGRYKILLDIEKGGANNIYKVEMSFKWFDVDPTKRQLLGFEREPWFGCDKGVFKGGGVINSTPAINTQMAANIWYDIVYEASSVNGYDNQKFGLFTLENYPQYQSYGSIKNDFKVYRNDELIGHYITCTNPSNVYGVFNTVTQTFCPLTNY